MAKKDLAQIIRDNPDCVAVIDNDAWWLYRKHPSMNPHLDDDDFDAEDKWNRSNELASYRDDFHKLGDGGYGSGNSYGGDILQALAQIVGIEVESV